MTPFSRRPAQSRRVVLEVEILEDRLPLSASPLNPLVLPLAAPQTPPTHVAPFVVAAPTVLTTVPGSFGTTNAGPGVFTPLGPTGLSNGMSINGQPNGLFGYGPYSFNPSNPLNGNPASASTTPVTTTSPLPTPFAGVQQQSSDGQAIVDKTRQISGIDSRVFDPRTQDRLILRDQREVRGLGDPNDLVLQPQPVPVPATPSTTPNSAPQSENIRN